MNIVCVVTWTDMRNVVHTVEWGYSMRTYMPGYFIVCSGAMVAKQDDVNHTPTCVYCVASK